MVIWHRLAGFLVIGYLSLGRSFAYLGIPPLKIFIGEIALGVFLLLKPRVVLGTWLASLLGSLPLNALGLALFVFMAYGAWQVVRGVVNGSPVLFTLTYFVFNYYAFYLFLGIWIALKMPNFPSKLARAIALVNGIYGLLYVVVLKSVPVNIPGTLIPIFGEPAGAAIAILGLLCFERSLAAVWPLLALNAIVSLTMQVRAEWLGLALGALVWGVLTKRLGRVVAIGVAGLAMLVLIQVAGIKIGGRASEVSLGNIVGRVVAPIDEELASEFSPDADEAAGTMKWRQQWWEQIWRSAHSTPMLAAFGHGYGFDLFSLAPQSVRRGQMEIIRTPHNVFYYALGYTGWVGVVIFFYLQITILRVLWKAHRAGGHIAGLIWWISGMSMAFFSNFFETPFGAIPFYLLVGMAMAPGLTGEARRLAYSTRPQLLSKAGG